MVRQNNGSGYANLCYIIAESKKEDEETKERFESFNKRIRQCKRLVMRKKK
ncbi:hypothetical protein WUBG_18998, partial [Wuchereria bancrofti]